MATVSATALNTGSYLYAPGTTTNRTGVGLSTMIVVKVGTITIGAIQDISISETRNISMFNEVGTDGNIDSAPTGSTVHSGSCKRLRYDGVRLFAAFGAGYLHVKSQRIPFDIEIIDRYNTDENGAGEISTTLKNVWFKDMSFSYSADNWLVTETANFVFETIYSTVNNSPAATGGARGLPIRLDAIEQASDTGSRRGSLDAPGLIAAAFKA